MTTHLRALSVLTAALLASGCATADNPAPKPQADAPAPASAPTAGGSVAKGALPVLKVGSTADEIVQLVGKPLDVTPKPSPEGKAEVWTYRRIVDQTTGQVASGMNNVQAYNPIPGTTGSAPDLQFKLVHYTIYQVTSLLVFDGKLVTAKQWLEKVADYN
jgi:outer membrane protein assembly factor BamE (lipoprotein component of BamABCDE complex)